MNLHKNILMIIKQIDEFYLGKINYYGIGEKDVFKNYSGPLRINVIGSNYCLENYGKFSIEHKAGGGYTITIYHVPYKDYQRYAKKIRSLFESVGLFVEEETVFMLGDRGIRIPCIMNLYLSSLKNRP